MTLNKLLFQIFSVFTIVLVQITLKCKSVPNIVTVAVDNIPKIRNPFYSFRSNEIPISKSETLNKTLINIKEKNILNISVATKVPVKKWQVGRVKRKQYEIINMLWRKSIIFLDEETTSEQYSTGQVNNSKKNIEASSYYHKLHTFLPKPIFPASTPSFIEFYYLDETDDTREITSPKYVSNYARNKENRTIRNLGGIKLALLNPIFAFHINNPNYKRSTPAIRYMHPTNKIHQRKVRTYKSSLGEFTSDNYLEPPYIFAHKLLPKVTTTVITYHTKLASNVTQTLFNSSITESTNENITCPITTESLTELNTTGTINSSAYEIQHSTAYDKIKFFEMYDKNTYEPIYEKRKLINTDDIEIITSGNGFINDKKNILENVYLNMSHDHKTSYKTKHAKKHIIENYSEDVLKPDNLVDNKLHLKPLMGKPLMTTVPQKKKAMRNGIETEMKLPKFLQQNMSTYASWSEYPYAAVYVYEPLQVHCDAAGISQHWLICAGACLTRHHKKPGGTGRSAFVTYCGVSWWNPERVAYVKYSAVHPSYHPLDNTRRHLYNLGLIQVVSSMASACTGWSPIPLMSHQLISDNDGTTALGSAIGWGLDRFDTRYPLADLPRLPLSRYESHVYSDSCPGNVEYSKTKRLEDDEGIKNLYCLSLPPYYREENDPVHGSLLLVEGKLIALYLQEERRPWGQQCAQYTGIWRLMPWLLDVAHEPDDADSFMVEI